MPNWTSQPDHTYDEDTGEEYSYEKYSVASDEKVKVTYHKDGGKTYHLSGPCGPRYVDRNGES